MFKIIQKIILIMIKNSASIIFKINNIMQNLLLDKFLLKKILIYLIIQNLLIVSEALNNNNNNTSFPEFSKMKSLMFQLF